MLFVLIRAYFKRIFRFEEVYERNYSLLLKSGKKHSEFLGEGIADIEFCKYLAILGGVHYFRCVYASLPDDRFTRLTVIELQKTFLRYQGSLYIASHSAPYDVDLPGYHAKHCHSTGEIVTYIRGDHLPTEDLTTHSVRYDGCEIFRNENEPDMLYLKQVRTLSNGRIQTEYEPFVKAEVVGLDYSAYEWK